MTTGAVIEVDPRTGEVLGGSDRALTKLEQLGGHEIIAAIRGRVTEKWVYSYPQGGATVVGLSIVGVEQAAREMAIRGEVLRELEVKLEYEDEREARFLATAGRFAVNGAGSEFALDIAIRAKRQSKYITLRTGGERFNESWYEVGVAKAVRNAKGALINDTVRRFILEEAKASGALPAHDDTSAPARSAPAQAPTATTPTPSNDLARAWGAFWATARAQKLSKADTHALFGVPTNDGALSTYVVEHARQSNIPHAEQVDRMRQRLA